MILWKNILLSFPQLLQTAKFNVIVENAKLDHFKAKKSFNINTNNFPFLQYIKFIALVYQISK